MGPQYLRVAAETIGLVLEQDSVQVQKYILKPLMSPLLNCLQGTYHSDFSFCYLQRG